MGPPASLTSAKARPRAAARRELTGRIPRSSRPSLPVIRRSRRRASATLTSMLPVLSGAHALGSGEDLGSEVLSKLEGEHVAVMLFGSCARGDQNAASDVDVLQLVERWRLPYEAGRCSVSVYTCARLFELARAGSLFVLHLVTEGRTIHDPTGTLSRNLAAYRAPADYIGARDKLRRAASVLDVDRASFERNPDGFLRIGLHIYRTALYVRCIERGTPVFSMPRVARLLGEPRIGDFFTRREPRGFPFFLDPSDLSPSGAPPAVGPTAPPRPVASEATGFG